MESIISGRSNRLKGLVWASLFALGLLGACSAPSQVRVLERQTIDPRIATEKIGGTVIRIVQPGDTLHAIAFASGLNVNQLAAWNSISDTSRLHIGQRIRLTEPLGFVGTVNSPRLKSKAQANNKKAIAKATPKKSQPSSKGAEKFRSLQWVWPAQGSVIGRFATSQSQQGIDIQAEIGSSVVAAAAGEVVYVGNGLKGYGNLVIIKHDSRYLSAYAHNQETFVLEGEQVAARHSIGSVGLDKQRRSAVHFQIRRDGEPVNPLAYLPKQ